LTLTSVAGITIAMVLSVTNKLKGLLTMNKQTQKQRLKSIRRRAIANQNNSPNKKTIAEAIKEVKNV
jgi:hypothetical protein